MDRRSASQSERAKRDSILVVIAPERYTVYGKDFLSIADLSSNEVGLLIERAAEMKGGPAERPLEGRTIAMLFEKPSLRTRVSFEIGIRRLGGDCFHLGGPEVGLGEREPVPDVARVLDRWVDGIVARVNSHESLSLLAEYTTVPIINALSDVEHPCQAMADLLTILEHRGRLGGQRVAYVGDGNNVAASLALACASVGASFVIASPPDYRVNGAIWEEAERRAGASGGVEWVELPEDAARDADVVYTDVWVSMGQDAESKARHRAFQGYQVSPALMALARPDAIFMHDMPAHEGEEITPGMLDHPQSVVFDQAENRLHAQNAVLAHLFDDSPSSRSWEVGQMPSVRPEPVDEPESGVTA